MTEPILPASAPQPPAAKRARRFDPTSWGGALAIMIGAAAVLYAVELANSIDHHGFNRFGLKPRRVDGLWGILTAPFLHAGWWQLLGNTLPFVLIGWFVLISGVRLWLVVTALIVVVGDAATWLVAPSGTVVGANALVFGWLGYLLARAIFARKILWILGALVVASFFSSLFGGLVPSVDKHTSWQAHLCGFLAGALVGWFLHPRSSTKRASAPPVS